MTNSRMTNSRMKELDKLLTKDEMAHLALGYLVGRFWWVLLVLGLFSLGAGIGFSVAP